MNDYDKLKTLLDEFGVKYEESIEQSKEWPSGKVFDENAKIIMVKSDEGCEKVTGYSGFLTCFDFTNEGKFIQMGAWE